MQAKGAKMTDLFAEVARVRAEYPKACDEVVAMIARFRIADARGNDDLSREYAVDLVAFELACTPWWAWVTQPKLWLVWLALQVALWSRPTRS
jgi:hypothetical protein